MNPRPTAHMQWIDLESMPNYSLMGALRMLQAWVEGGSHQRRSWEIPDWTSTGLCARNGLGAQTASIVAALRETFPVSGCVRPPVTLIETCHRIIPELVGPAYY